MGLVHTVDIITLYRMDVPPHTDGIVLIERLKEPFGLALPGGKLEIDETLEDCAVRELKEETNLVALNLRQFHTYSAPLRDPRFRAISTVFIAENCGNLRAMSDAKRVQVFRLEQIDALKDSFAFDHYQILKDYQASLKK